MLPIHPQLLATVASGGTFLVGRRSGKLDLRTETKYRRSEHYLRS
jgi:hypothetical protein